MSPRRILMLSANFHPVIGGSENQALLLSRELVRRGHTVHVLTLHRDSSPREEVVDGITIHRRIKPWGPGPIWRRLYFRQCRRQILRLAPQIDIIHSHHLYLHTLAALEVARPLNLPVVCKPATGGPFGDLARLRSIAPQWVGAATRADRFIALNEYLREELSSAGFPVHNIALIPNMVDAERFFPPSRHEPRHDNWLLYLGRLAPQKNLPLLLRAFATVARQRPELSLRLVGEGSEAAALRRLADELSVADQIVFTGRVTDPRPQLQYATMLVHPSIGEGMANALLEAMATATPIVATDIPPNRELLAPPGAEIPEDQMPVAAEFEMGAFALLAPPDAPDAFAQAILHLLQEKELRDWLGAAARAEIEERYAVPKIVDRYEALYEEVIAEKESS